MANVASIQLPPTPDKLAPPEHKVVKQFGLIAAVVALLVVVLMPAPLGLAQAGQAMLGILVHRFIKKHTIWRSFQHPYFSTET